MLINIFGGVGCLTGNKSFDFGDPNHDPNTVIFNGIFDGIFAGIFTIAVKGKLNEF